MPVQPQPIHSSHPTYSRIKMTKWPSIKALGWHNAVNIYDATFIREALARFIVSYANPALTRTAGENASLDIRHRVASIPVYHKLKITGKFNNGIMDTTRDAVHARPTCHDQQGRPVPARFDTVLPTVHYHAWHAITGYHVRRVRLIFTLPKKIRDEFLAGVIAPRPLA
ncbi:hypothetical protein C8Q80DRAFT_1274923 [Daedaleopsis nitida]|nr:hypothetical protein C8Q80DRAFT_1274923 [Daedaleopsis nitida]